MFVSEKMKFLLHEPQCQYCKYYNLGNIDLGDSYLVSFCSDISAFRPHGWQFYSV